MFYLAAFTGVSQTSMGNFHVGTHNGTSDYEVEMNPMSVSPTIPTQDKSPETLEAPMVLTARQNVVDAIQEHFGDSRTIADVATGTTSGLFRDMKDRVQAARELFFQTDFSAYGGSLVRAASMLPTVNRETGEVVPQSPDTFSAAFRANTPEAVTNRVLKLVASGDQNGLRRAVDLPLIQGWHLANATSGPGQSSLLDPQVVKTHASNKALALSQQINAACPYGTERPILFPLSVPAEEGFIQVYGYQRGRGVGRQVAVVDPMHEPGMVRLVSKVNFEAVPTEGGSFRIQRSVPKDGVLAEYPVRDEAEIKMFNATMLQQGWDYIQPDHYRADMPETIRRNGSQFLSARGVLETAKAIEMGAMDAGVEAGLNGTPVSESLPPHAKAVAEAYKALTYAIQQDHTLTTDGIRTVLHSATRPMAALSALDRKVQDIMANPEKFADSELHIRLAVEGKGRAAIRDTNGTPINFVEQLSETEAKSLRRHLNQIEEHAKSTVESARRAQFNAGNRGKEKQIAIPEMERVETLHVMVRDLADQFDLYQKDDKGQRIPVVVNEETLTWPDGKVRHHTYLDEELVRGENTYHELNELSAKLQNAVQDASYNLDQIHLVMAASNGLITNKQLEEVEPLLDRYIKTQMKIPGASITNDERRKVENALRPVPEFAWMDELKGSHVYGALAAADTLKLSYVRRDMVAMAYDQFPASRECRLNPFNQKNYEAPPYPEMSSKLGTIFIQPETEDKTSYSIIMTAPEGGYGSPTFEHYKRGLTYPEMVNERRSLSFQNSYIVMSNQPLPSGSALPVAVAQAYRLPVLPNFPDPSRDGDPATAVLLGVSVHAGGVGTGISPGNHRVVIYTTPMVDKAFTRIHHDESQFTARFRKDDVAKTLTDFKVGLVLNPTQIRSCVDDIFRRRGRYHYDDGMDAHSNDTYVKHRERSVQVMAAFHAALAARELFRARKSGADPDRIADLENAVESRKADLQADPARKPGVIDARMFAKNELAFREQYKNRPAEPWIGLAPDLSGSKMPPHMLRWESTTDMVNSESPRSLDKLSRNGAILNPQIVFAD